MSTSYPYWSLARDLDLDYGQVLSCVEFLEQNPGALKFWLSLETGSECLWYAARALRAERERRRG